MTDSLSLNDVGKHVYHRGKKYVLGPAGRRTCELLRDISSSPACQSTRGLLMLRPRIRDSLMYPRPVLLSLAIDKSRNTRVLRIALWMLGRIGHPYATKSVIRHVDHSQFPVRREAIRTLRRLHAWSDLRRIEREHPDSRIRALAKPASPKAYSDRLAQFVSSSDSLEPIARTRDVVIDANVDLGQGRPPKSRGRIAAVLRRIHRLVRRTRRRRSVLWLRIAQWSCRSH